MLDIRRLKKQKIISNSWFSPPPDFLQSHSFALRKEMWKPSQVTDFRTAENMKDSQCIFVHQSLVRILWCVFSLPLKLWHQQETEAQDIPTTWPHTLSGWCNICLRTGKSADYLEWHASHVIYCYKSLFKDNTARGSRPTTRTAVPDCCTGSLFNSVQLNDFLALTLHPVNTASFDEHSKMCEIKLCMGAYQCGSDGQSDEQHFLCFYFGNIHYKI